MLCWKLGPDISWDNGKAWHLQAITPMSSFPHIQVIQAGLFCLCYDNIFSIRVLMPQKKLCASTCKQTILLILRGSAMNLKKCWKISTHWKHQYSVLLQGGHGTLRKLQSCRGKYKRLPDKLCQMLPVFSEHGLFSQRPSTGTELDVPFPPRIFAQLFRRRRRAKHSATVYF